MTHHRAGLARELKKRDTYDMSLLDALEAFGGGSPLSHEAVSEKDQALLDYAMALTVDPGGMKAAHVEALRAAGCDDG
ncbi:MAG: hypothetical protein GY910_16150, partial [bacterium]|nr:hypothetical protein [bacterium]